MNGEGGERSSERFAAGDQQLSVGREGWESGGPHPKLRAICGSRRATIGRRGGVGVGGGLRAICNWRQAIIGRRGGVGVGWCGAAGKAQERFASGDEQLSDGGGGGEGLRR